MANGFGVRFGVEGQNLRGMVGCQTNTAAKPEGVIYDATRTWDCKGGVNKTANVRVMYPSAGVYDFSPIDGMLQGTYGLTVHTCLGCPPDWVVTRPNSGVNGAYGGKSNMVPDDLDAYCEFVDAFARHLLSYGAVVHGDTWNEINGAGFFNDDTALLGPYVRRVAETIRAVQPDAYIYAPNTNYSGNDLAAVMQVSDGVGGTIADHCNAASVHIYHDARTVPEIAVNGTRNRIRLISSRVPSSWLVSLNESGIEMANPRAGIIHATRLAVSASMGVPYVAYTYDHTTYGMDAPVISAWNQVAEVLTDATLIDCRLQHGQVLRLETTKGVRLITADGVTSGT